VLERLLRIKQGLLKAFNKKEKEGAVAKTKSLLSYFFNF
jgi:hypothetical protein